MVRSIPSTPERILHRLAQEFDDPPTSLARLLDLLEQGYRIPYLAHCRGHEIGIAEERMYEIRRRLNDVRILEEHKAHLLDTAEREGRLDDEFVERVLAFHDIDRLEAFFAAARTGPHGRAAEAQARGLLPLAQALEARQVPEGKTPLDLAEAYVAPDRGVPDAKAALEGAKGLLLDKVVLTEALREAAWNAPVRVVTKRTLPKELTYFAKFEKPARSVHWHELLTMRKAARAGLIELQYGLSEERAHQILAEHYCKDLAATDPLRNFWDSLLREAWLDRLRETCERDIMREMKEHADVAAIRQFARNYRDLLLQPAAGPVRVCGVLPAIRKPTRLAAIDEHGELVAHLSCQPLEAEQREAVTGQVRAFLSEHAVKVLALGAGPGCREIEGFLFEALQGLEGRPQIVTVDESGIPALMRRDAGRHDLATRKACLLARRIQDPLLEWVRIPPTEVPLGDTMEEVHQAHLLRYLEDVRESCLHAVGVDLRHAPEEVLQLVAGLDRPLAQKLSELRQKPDGLVSKRGLVETGVLGELQLEQAAPFLRLAGGSDPLDATRIEIRHYGLAEAIATTLGLTVAQLFEQPAQTDRVRLDDFVRDGVDKRTVRHVLDEIRRPFRDPRPSFDWVAFDPKLKSLDDLQMGLELHGRVTRIAEFGAFVDIGVAPGGLLHVSQMADRYVGDPHRFVHEGQVVRVRVLEIDRTGRRVSLTMRSGEIRKVQRTLGDMAEGKKKPSAVVVPIGSGGEAPEREPRVRAAVRRFGGDDPRGGRGARREPGGGRPGGGRPGGGREGGGRGDARGGGDRPRSGFGDRRFGGRDDRGGSSGRGSFTVESADISEAEKAARGAKGELKSFAALASMLTPKPAEPQAAVPSPPASAPPAVAQASPPEPPPQVVPKPDEPAPPAPPAPFGSEYV